MITPWLHPDWLEDASTWIAAFVSLTGQVSFLRPDVRAWSVTLRVPTINGPMWFKEMCPALAFEPALTQELARLAPGYTPEVVAAEGSRLLLANAGEPITELRRARSPAWLDVVARYAELQKAVVPDAAALPAPDYTPATLARRFEGRADELVEAVGDTIPLSIVHLGVQPSHLLSQDGRIVFIDWGVAGYAHAFSGLVKTFHKLVSRLRATPGGPEVLRIRDAYLEPWTTYAPAAELRRIFGAANALGALCRVAAWEDKLASVPPKGRRGFEHKPAKSMSIFEALAHDPGALGTLPVRA